MADDDKSEQQRFLRRLTTRERALVQTRLSTDAPRDAIPADDTRRSWYRVKTVALTATFAACWLAGFVGTAAHGFAVASIAAISVMFLYFVRCERCRSSLYYRAGGARAPWKVSFLWAKRCPCCELERI
jgi:hypothetical protein